MSIYTTSLRPAWRSDAARGGPQGEIRMVDDLSAGLSALGCRVKRISTLRWFYARRTVERLLGRLTPPGWLVLDPWTLELAQSHGLIDDRDATRLRVLEWYGTPIGRLPPAPKGLHAAQFLLPYPDPRHGNSWVGFVLRDPTMRPIESRADLATSVRGSMRAKKRQGLIWGKEPRYFTEPVRRTLAELGSHCELHITISKERLGGESFPGFVNHGAISFAEWRALIRDSAFVIGLGDPIGGPTAIEAIAAGCVYLNPSFTPPRRVNDVPGLEVGSQHPYAGTIPPPFVRSIAIDRPDEVAQAAVVALERARAGRDDDLTPLLDALEPFTWRSYLGRVAAEFGLASGEDSAPRATRATPRW